MAMVPTASYDDFKGPSLMDRLRNLMHPLRWFRRRFLRKPGSTLGLTVATLLGGGIIVNALALQTERHPSPIFAPLVVETQVAPVEMPVPPVRPQSAERRPDAAAPAAQPGKVAKASPAPVAREPETPAAKTGSPRDQMLAIIKNGAEPASETPNRTLQVQRALNRAGYGPLKEDGAFGPGTKQALERFETDRKIPVRGEATGRTARELSRASGIAIE